MTHTEVRATYATRTGSVNPHSSKRIFVVLTTVYVESIEVVYVVYTPVTIISHAVNDRREIINRGVYLL